MTNQEWTNEVRKLAMALWPEFPKTADKEIRKKYEGRFIAALRFDSSTGSWEASCEYNGVAHDVNHVDEGMARMKLLDELRGMLSAQLSAVRDRARDLERALADR